LGLRLLCWFLWMLTQFTAALHGFERGFVVFMGIIAALFVAALAMAVLLGMFGFVPQAGA